MPGNARALRELFADFEVAFDKAKSIEKGNAALNRLRGNAEKTADRIKSAFAHTGKGLSDVNIRANATGKAIGDAFRRPSVEFKTTQARVERVGREFDKTGRQAATLSGALGGLTRAFGALGLAIGSAAIVQGMTRFISNTIRMGDELDKTSQQLGITANDLQSLRLAADLSGAGTERMNVALAQLSQKLFMAHSRGGEMAALFRRIGVDFRDSSGDMRELQDVMDDLADAIQNTENPTERVGIAMQIFGENGRYLLPMLLDGSEGMRRMRAELEQLGGGMSDLAIQRSVELHDSITRLRTAWQQLRSFFATRLFPAIDWLVQKGTALGTTITNLVGNSRLLEATIGVLAGVLVAAGIQVTAAWVGPSLILAAIAISIGVLILLVDDLIVTAEGGDSVIRRFVDSLFGIGTTATAVNTVRDAIADLAYYVEVMRADFELAWTEMQPYIDPVAKAIRMVVAAIDDVVSRLGIAQNAASAFGSVLRWLNPLASVTAPLTQAQAIGSRRRQDVEGAWQAARPAGTGARLMAPGGPPPVGTGTMLADLPSRGGGTSNTVDARTSLNVAFNGITDTGEINRQMGVLVRENESRQARQIQAALRRGSE